MAEMKNICGKIPMELHAKMRQEIEQREISTQQFIQQVIEEHFTEKGGQINMAVRTVAVQVSEELFARLKAAVAKKGCRQKDFLIELIEKAIEEIEAEFEGEKAVSEPLAEETKTEAPPAEQEGESTEVKSGDEPTETGSEETGADESTETEAEDAEDGPEGESGETEEPTDVVEPDGQKDREPDEMEAGKAYENEEAPEPEAAGADEPEQEPEDMETVA